MRKGHHNNEAVKLDKVAKTNAFNVSQFAYMIKRLHSLRERDGTLLDNAS